MPGGPPLGHPNGHMGGPNGPMIGSNGHMPGANGQMMGHMPGPNGQITLGGPGGPLLGPGGAPLQLTGAQAEQIRKKQDLETLKQIITQWNANRLDLFELSVPNEELEFTGVMRFYYQAQDLGSGQKVATKCIRVTSTATTKTIIETLIEKFRPDMKMLEVPEYALYEIHESGERRLGLDEKPLLVQLNWHKDDREGRFLLRRIDEASHMPQPTQEDSSFKRKLSKREKKALKKQEKKEKVNKKDNQDESMAEKLYTELPDTSFTRSISNPEAVMRRRRQQKLERKLQQFRSKDGGPDTGGTLKIYGEAIRKDVPYKTLLLSVRDTAAGVVLEMLDKYGVSKSEALNYCLVQSNLTMPEDGGQGQVLGGGTTREYMLDDGDCPLGILMQQQMARPGGALTFHVRRRPNSQDGGGRHRIRKKKSGSGSGQVPGQGQGPNLPYLIELTPEGADSRVFHLQPDRFTEVGSEVGPGGVELQGLLPRHCVLASTEGVVTVTPCSQQADIGVNNQRLGMETTILQHGNTVRFGRSVWRFHDPSCEAGPGPGGGEGSRQGNYSNSSTLPPGFPGGEHGGSTATLNELQGQPGNRASTAQYPHQGGGQSRGKDAILPAVLEFREDTEENFFNALTLGLEPGGVTFKLAPTYTLYMATRFRASTHYRPELVPEERAVRLTEMLNRVADKILQVIQSPPHQGVSSAPLLSFWMANSSELLHFLKCDRHITAFSLQAQFMLADAVHIAFKQLVATLQGELESVLPSLLSDVDDPPGDQGLGQGVGGIIKVFSSAMGLLRKCRVNAALTIQLFSQLFHFVNMWTFNMVMAGEGSNYCTHKWGLRLKRRLDLIEKWAEKQGLELAADCHLARITQAAHLLQARKATAEDIASLSSTCFKLNSLQLECLLSRYTPAENEAPINRELIETIVRVAQNTVDELTRAENRAVRLEEDYVLQLPFLLPEDNYSSDIMRGVPGGLQEFIQPIQAAGLAVMTPQPSSSGYWTIYMDSPPPLTPVPRSPSEMSQVTNLGDRGSEGFDGPPVGQVQGHPPQPFPQNGGQRFQPPNQEPELVTIRLSKTNGMGLSIVAAKGVGCDKLGIYIKAVVEGGAAWQDGRLQAGDQLIRVDGQSLVGISQERAADIMMRTGSVATLDVAKRGAYFHGLATLLAQPSPVMGGRPPSRGPQEMRPPEQPTSRGPLPQGHPGHRMSTSGPLGQFNGPNHPPAGPKMSAGPPELPGRLPMSKSTPSLGPPGGSNSPGSAGESHHQGQHNYQNHEWLHHQMAPQPSQRIQGPSSRSTSIQNLHMGPPGPRPDSDSSYYQNLSGQGGPGPVPPPGTLPRHLQGSNSSLAGSKIQQPVNSRDRPVSAHYPPQQQLPPGYPQHGHPPNIRPPGPGGVRFQPPVTVPGAPEKPMRQFSHEMPHQQHQQTLHTQEQQMMHQHQQMMHQQQIHQQQMMQQRQQQIQQQNRVRFQENQEEAVAPHLGKLTPQEVEQEFRRRVEQYESDDEDTKISTMKRNGALHAFNEKDKEEEKEVQDHMEREKARLNEPSPVEEKVLAESLEAGLAETLARRRALSDGLETGGPPPLPSSTPPRQSPSPPGLAMQTTGTHRLDMLLGSGSGTLGRPKPPKAETPSKRVSFMPPEELTHTTGGESDESDVGSESVDKDADSDGNEDGSNEDPNAFISEAEQMLNSATMGLSRMDFSGASHTGHTPSVIGTQEIYRDPRSRRLAEEKEKKLSQEKPPDGAKLSFQEKMKLFAQEVGENTPRDKAKISKAQREIGD